MWKTETKVGLFTLIGAILFLYVTLFLSHIQIFAPPEYTVVGKFNSVTGLKKGNTVRYSGVPVGKVDGITVGENGVTVTMDIDKSVEIPSDSKFALQTDGLLGERYVSITPGTDKTMLTNGSYVEGQSANEVDATVTQVNKVLQKADLLLDSINNVVADESVQRAMKSSIRNTDELTANMANLTSQMNAMLVHNQRNINEIAHNMAVVSQNMTDITDQLNKSLENIDGDGKSSENIRDILQNLKDSTAALNAMAQTLEGVVTDKQTAEDIKATIHNTAEISGVVTKVIGGNGLGIHGNGTAEMLYTSNGNNKYNPNLDYTITTKDKVFSVGSHYIGNGTKTDLHVGKIIGGKTAISTGMYDSKFGIGLDLGLPKHRFGLSAAFMNFNDPQYRLRAKMKVSDTFGFVGQWVRPYSASHSGNYYGVQYNF